MAELIRSASFEPGQVHAVVVGLEKYVEWELDGPAAEALAFAEWLLERDVPAGNIDLLLAPLDAHEDLLHRASLLLGRVVERVEQQAVFDDTFTRLTRCVDGELLYVFWGGHGVMADGGDESRYLFTPDARTDHQRCLNLRAVRRLLHGTPALREQHFLVDACATFVEAQHLPRHPTPSTLPVQDRNPDVVQRILCACGPGEVARNNRGSGVFSRTVLDWLRVTEPKLGFDLATLQRYLHDELDGLSAGNALIPRQTPTFLDFYDHDRITLARPLRHALDSPKVGEASLALRDVLPKDMRRTHVAYAMAECGRRITTADPDDRELAQLLLSDARLLPALIESLRRPAPDRARSLYHEAVEGFAEGTTLLLSPRERRELDSILDGLTVLSAEDLAYCTRGLTGLPAGIAGSPAGQLSQVLDHLEGFLPWPGSLEEPLLVPLLVQVTERVAALADVPLQKRWWRLGMKVCQRIGVAPGALAQVRAQEAQSVAEWRSRIVPARRVVVELDVTEQTDHGPSRFSCCVWTTDAHGELAAWESAEGGPDDVAHHIQRAVHRVNSGPGEGMATVEIVLPWDQAALHVEDWPVPHPMPGIVAKLGSEYPVRRRIRKDSPINRASALPWRQGEARLSRTLYVDAGSVTPQRAAAEFAQHEGGRAVILGQGPSAGLLAQLAACYGYPVILWSHGAETGLTEDHVRVMEPEGPVDHLVRAAHRHRVRTDGYHPAPPCCRPSLVWDSADLPLPSPLPLTRFAAQTHPPQEDG